MNRGYADLFFRKDYSVTDLTEYEYLVELKYIKSDDLPSDPRKLEELICTVKQEAVTQLLNYRKSRKITCKLIQLVIICSSREVLLIEEVK